MRQNLEQYLAERFGAQVANNLAECVRSQYQLLGEHGCRASLKVDLGLADYEIDDVLWLIDDVSANEDSVS